MVARKKPPRTALQAVFLKRVQDEMRAQGLSGNALAQRKGAPAQRTIADVLNGADPRLETVAQIAAALEVQAWTLFTESSAALDLREIVRLHTPERAIPPARKRRAS